MSLLAAQFCGKVSAAANEPSDEGAAQNLGLWLCKDRGNSSADVLRLLVSFEWSSMEAQVIPGLFSSLRLAIDRLLRSQLAVDLCLEGALDMAVHSARSSDRFAIEILSLPHLVSRMASQPARSALIDTALVPHFEASVVALKQTKDLSVLPPGGEASLLALPTHPGTAWLLGNLVKLSVMKNITSEAYLELVGRLLGSLPQGCLVEAAESVKVKKTDSSDSDEDEAKKAASPRSTRLSAELQAEIKCLSGESHLKSTLVAALSKIKLDSPKDMMEVDEDVVIVQSTKGYSIKGEAEALACCEVYARLADELPTSGEYRLLHTVASPTYKVLLPLWKWLVGSREMDFLEDGNPLGTPLVPVLDLFCRAFNRRLLLLDDDEFYEKQALVTLDTVREIVVRLKKFLVQVYWTTPQTTGSSDMMGYVGPAARSAGRLLRDLHQKNCRREFAPASEWTVTEIPASHFSDNAGAQDPRLIPMLRDLPHFIPFQFRASLFTVGVKADMDLQPNRLDWAQYQRVTIRRQYEVEDGFDQLNHLGAEGALRGHIRIKYLDAHGLEEAGIDGGGLFKEFLTNVIRAGFNPDFGLFKSTANSNIYPNPASEMSGPGELHLHYIAFLGRMVGKALYEGILVELPLATFFLNKLLGRPNQVGDLYSLDPELARHLMSIKQWAQEGELDDLGLYFVMTEQFGYGEKREVELTPGGKDRAVTRANHIEYIYCVADYYLNRQISRQCRAFLKGFQDVIKPEWLRMFSSTELHHLISGTEEVLDVDDFKAHTNYSGEFNKDHPTIQNFWTVVSEMSNSDRSKLLRFVTSCSRPPLLGFKQVQPAFCIHFGGPGDSERLPSASTCMNLLKLPAYEKLEVLREKLTLAITQTSGFGLS